MARAIAASLLIGFVGCDSGEAVLSTALPETEPIAADEVDVAAVQQFRQKSDIGSSELPQTDWPQLFGPGRTCRVGWRPDVSWPSSGPEELWSREVGTGYGSPVVAGDRVVFNHREVDFNHREIDQELVQCVSASTGELLWEHSYETTAECDYDYSDGPYSTPLIDNENVYVIGGQGQAFSLELETGEVVWSRDLHGDYDVEPDMFPVGASPGLAGDLLILSLGASDRGAGVVALNRNTGETVWEATDHGASYTSPFEAEIHGQQFVFVVTAQGLVSLHPETGEVDWMVEHYSRAPMSFNAVSPLVHEDKVLMVTGPGPGAICVRVTPDRGHELVWRDRRKLDSQFNTLMLYDGDVYGFTAAGQGGAELRCLDFATGELKWKYHSVLKRGQGLIADDILILLGERGHLASLLPSEEGLKVLAFTEEPLMQEPCYCAPALSGNRLFLKDEERLVCFALQ